MPRAILMICVFSFFAAFFIPFLARRFGKFLPADAGTALVKCFHRPRSVRSNNAARAARRSRLRGFLLTAAVLYGATGAATAWFLTAFGFSPLFLLMFFICALLANIDERLHLLPDVLTVPLIITGFAAAAFGLTGISPATSAGGALAGFLLPTVTAAIMSAIRPRALGGGDYKMLAGVGAWVGFLGLSVAILSSFFFFVLFAVGRKSKEGPYGSALLAGVLTLFVLEAFGNFTSFFVAV